MINKLLISNNKANHQKMTYYCICSTIATMTILLRLQCYSVCMIVIGPPYPDVETNNKPATLVLLKIIISNLVDLMLIIFLFLTLTSITPEATTKDF